MYALQPQAHISRPAYAGQCAVPVMTAPHAKDGSFAMRDCRDHDAIVVRVYGDVDMFTAPRLASHLDFVIEKRPALVVVDLADVRFLSSTGLSVLLEARRLGEQFATPVRVVAIGPAVVRPMQIAAVDTMLNLYPTVDAALASTVEPPICV